jgi:hypothetical protein
MSETLHQKHAKQFDAKLFALLYQALTYSNDRKRSAQERAAWNLVRVKLSEARPSVKDVLHGKVS